MSSQIKLHGTPPSWGALTKRTIHTLTDGSCVAIVWDQNESDEITGDKDDVVDMHVYWSANRTAWTLKLTRSDTGWQGMIGVYSSFLDANNDLHVIARTTAGVVYTKLVYAANAGAPTWTFDAWETVFSHSTANLPSTCQFLDLAVANISPTIQVPIVGTIRKSGSNWLAEIHVRKTDATAGWVRKWPSVIVLGQSLYTNSNDLSIAVEAAPVSATDVRVAIMYVKIGATSGDLGDTLEIVSVNTQTGDVSGSVNRMVFDNLNQGEGNKARNCFLFATTGNNFVWGEAVGVTSGGYVCSGRVDRDGNTIIPATYSSEGLAIDRTNARWNQATAATYQDGGLNFTYVGTDGYIRNIIASRNGTTRLYFSDPTFWDNRYKLGPYYAVALYGGGSRNLDSGFRKHDSYANYGRNTSTASSREFRHQFAQVFRAPAAVRPGNGTTVDTDQPDLGIDADIDQKYPQSPMKGRWEFARDAAFTDSLRVFEQTEVFIRTGAAQGPPVRGRLVPIWYMVLDTNNAGVVVPMNDKLPATQELYSGTWYVRACYLDYFGIKHTYSPTATITVSHPPTAINLYPTGGEVKQWNGGQLVLNWGFRDTSPTDVQTAYQVVVQRNDDGSAIWDSTKTLSAERTVAVTLPGTAKDVELRWKVTLWDGDDAKGPDSAFQVFWMVDPPVVTVTEPNSATGPVATAKPTFIWDFTVGGGRVQAAYRVEVREGGDLVYGSGWRNGSSTSFTPPATILSNNSAYTVTVWARDSIGLEAYNSVAFTTQWVVPSAPSGVTVDASRYDVDGLGDIVISWADTGRDLEFYSWRVYRRVVMSDVSYFQASSWELVNEIFDINPNGYSMSDFLAPSGGHKVDYIVTQVAMRFGSIIESVTLQQLNVGTPTPHGTVFPASPTYWLIDATGSAHEPGLNMKLLGVTSDTFTDDHEREEYHVIGLGRKVAEGDRLGFNGTLTVRIRMDGESSALYPRARRLKLEDLKSRQSPVYIRSPFGDVFKVKLSDFSWTRLAGVGTVEMMDLTVQYLEVAE